MKSWYAMPRWAGGLMLIGILALPASRRMLEAQMAAHMLVQIPLLALTGVLFASAVGARMQRTLERYNERGLPGMLLVLFASSYWMLPRALDAALDSPAMEVVKFFSLPLLVGLPLASSWASVGPVGRGFVLANAISMIGVVGWLYRQSPVRLCNYYLIDQQVLLGDCLLGLALLMGLVCAARAFVGSLPAAPRARNAVHSPPFQGGAARVPHPTLSQTSSDVSLTLPSP